ncbi:MAG: EAL domain-containing protein, partial [Nodosilinea sp.]
AILMLAGRLQLDVIVEGVETLDDMKCLQTLGFKKMQGYYFSKALGSAAIAGLLRHQALNRSAPPGLVKRSPT